MDFKDTFVCGFERALKSFYDGTGKEIEEQPILSFIEKCRYVENRNQDYFINENDLQFMNKTIKLGKEFRYFLRQITAQTRLQAPLSFWKDLNRYRGFTYPYPLLTIRNFSIDYESIISVLEEMEKEKETYGNAVFKKWAKSLLYAKYLLLLDDG